VLVLILKPEMFSTKLFTYRKRPNGSTTSEVELIVPVEKGEPGTGSSAPPDVMPNAQRLDVLESATYKNFPKGSTASARGSVPVAVPKENGDPLTGCRMPDESIEKVQRIPDGKGIATEGLKTRRNPATGSATTAVASPNALVGTKQAA
jgi:hypothetical protein